jgi:hypothetical protein
MRKRPLKNLVQTFLVSFSLVVFLSSTSNAAEQQSYRILFLGGEANIEFRPDEAPIEDGVCAYLTGVAKAGNVRVDCYETEGGVAPEIKSVFVSGQNPKRLFVIVAWGFDRPSIDTGGSLYQVFAYDERIEKMGKSPQLHENAELTHRFDVGFDGTREGHSVTYKYKNARAVRRQLLEWGYQ